MLISGHRSLLIQRSHEQAIACRPDRRRHGEPPSSDRLGRALPTTRAWSRSPIRPRRTPRGAPANSASPRRFATPKPCSRTPNSTPSTSPRRAQIHAPLVRLAAAKRLPVLCQKPLGVDLAEATAARRRGEGPDPPDGARELALSRLLSRRRGMAARRADRQRQAGAAHLADIGLPAGRRRTSSGAGAATVHAPREAAAGRRSADPSSRHAAHAAWAACR